jgi:hypothetical protein
MKTNFLEYRVLFLAIMLSVMTAKAQTVIYHDNITHDKQGKQVEQVQGNRNDKVYKMMLANDKMTELYVDGMKIPSAEWYKYDDAIAAIREQIRKNKEQALRNDKQARLNETENKKNDEQAVQNAAAAKLNETENKKNLEQARLNDIQNKKNDKQTRLNEVQAKKNHQENERLMKQIIAELISDKIIPDANSFHELALNKDEMTVNGIKQADDVFKKYREKYIKLSKGGFSYRK